MNKTLSRPLVMAFLVFALLVAAGIALTPSTTADDVSQTEAVVQAQVITPQEGCELLQTMTYTRCEHTVVRRTAAPNELQGKTLEDVREMYTDWQITEFAPKLIKMEKQMQLFCPDHLVLMRDGAGMLCVFENKYGDAMALVNELNIAVKDLPAAAREEAERGIGFSSAEEMEMWLESVES